MKSSITLFFRSLPIMLGLLLLIVSCQKIDFPFFDKDHGNSKETKAYPSEVLTDWIKLDLQLLRSNAAKLNNFMMMHHWAYSSIALYEAMLPGMPGYQTLSGQLSEMPTMPKTEHGKSYHWPTTANAVLAAMTRNFYMDSVTQGGKDSIKLLEDVFDARYKNEVNAATFERSKSFGAAIANRVYKWALTDGYLTQHPAYVLPVGPGQWERTPPDLLSPQRPYWGGNRSLIAGSVTASQIPPPPPFSTDPSSPFYTSANEVYDLSTTLTGDQRAQALFWRDVPGGGHAHWLSIFLQVLYHEGNKTMLDKAALVYAKLGISQNDARISCWKAKYAYNVIRPVSYLNAVIDPEKDWRPVINTPNHPEYPSAHSSFSLPAAVVLTAEFGENYAFTDDSYNFLNPPLDARSYRSFAHAAQEAGDSRVYGGIHFRFSVTGGAQLGGAVVKHMYDRIRFKKGG